MTVANESDATELLLRKVKAMLLKAERSEFEGGAR